MKTCKKTVNVVGMEKMKSVRKRVWEDEWKSTYVGWKNEYCEWVKVGEESESEEEV